MAENLIKRVLRKTEGLKQKDLAEKLGVTRAQVSKWNKGEEIPETRRRQLIELFPVVGFEIELAYYTDTKENLNAWRKFIDQQSKEIDISPDLFLDFGPVQDLSLTYLLKFFESLGLTPPFLAPKSVNTSYSDGDEINTIADLAVFALENLGMLEVWYTKFLLSIEDTSDKINSNTIFLIYEIENDLLDLTSLWLQPERSTIIDPNSLVKLRTRVEKDVNEKIDSVLQKLGENDIPVRADLYDLLRFDPFDLAEKAYFFSKSKNPHKYKDHSINKILDRLSFLTEEVSFLFERMERIEKKLDRLTPKS